MESHPCTKPQGGGGCLTLGLPLRATPSPRTHAPAIPVLSAAYFTTRCMREKATDGTTCTFRFRRVRLTRRRHLHDRWRRQVRRSRIYACIRNGPYRCIPARHAIYAPRHAAIAGIGHRCRKYLRIPQQHIDTPRRNSHTHRSGRRTRRRWRRWPCQTRIPARCTRPSKQQLQAVRANLPSRNTRIANFSFDDSQDRYAERGACPTVCKRTASETLALAATEPKETGDRLTPLFSAP
jgi:hypothetical protein